MIIKPIMRGFICATAHPEGCAHRVREQIEYVASRPLPAGPKKVLIIGASTGYGLASRIAASFGSGAGTIGVFFERPPDEKRTASPGWYNSAAFEREAARAGLWAKSVNGDAFSDDVKKRAIELIKEELGEVDLVVYSLASPRRIHPRTGMIHSSTLKPIGRPYRSKTVNFQNGLVSTVDIEPATPDEIENTAHVMGGEDWIFWMEALERAGVLAQGVQTVSYSYIGPQISYQVYRDGTIGRAKDHLEATALLLNERLKKIGGRAIVSVNKALVTQASAAIPVMPLYVSLLYKVMKSKGLQEGCIEQIHRLFTDHLYASSPPRLDEMGRIRLDDWEMRADVQGEIARLWEELTTENVEELSDLKGYREDFYRLFGFCDPAVDYEEEIEQDVKIPSLTPYVSPQRP